MRVLSTLIYLATCSCHKCTLFYSVTFSGESDCCLLYDYWRVFIQQDLTVKQREKRRELVQQLKHRKAQGETNLIIGLVRDKIVVKRQRQQQEQQQEAEA